MKCTLLVLLNIASVNALVYFETLEMNICRSEKNRFYVIVGQTIEQCVDECRARKHCESLNYRTKLNMCELFSTTNPDNLNHGDCIYADKRNLQPFQNHCKYGEVQETTGCVIKECVNKTIPKNGGVYGNMMNVGAKIRYICENGYKLKDNRYTSVAECLNTGHWSANAECVIVTYTWATWTGWSQCSVSCGGGQRTRTRTCTIPIQGIGDVPCLKNDPAFDTEACNHPPCEAPTIGNLCTVDADCTETEGTCIGGRCFCNYLYRYNVTLRNCIKVCDTLTDEFDVFDNIVISGYNDIEYRRPTDRAESCIQACISNINCLSLDIYTDTPGNMLCNLAIVTHDMMLDAYRENVINYTPWSKLYSRKCI